MASLVRHRRVRHLAVGLALWGTALLAAPGASASVVISQVYGGGGTAGAPYQNDFIELYNRGPTPQSLAGWSVQYADATSSSWSVTPLTSVTLQPGQYYLVKEASGGAVGALLPTADASGATNLSATAGKVALVNSTAAVTSVCNAPPGATILDLVGYGFTANCFEGNPAPAPGTTTADLRTNSGCTDTNNNGADFAAVAPNPRNTASTFNTLPICTITAASCVIANSTGNTASVPDAGVGATYSWILTNATITAGAGTNSIIYTAGASGSVGLSVTVANSTGCSIGCNAEVPTNITVSTNGGDRIECIGQQTCSLGGNAPPGGGSGLWTVDSGGTGTFSNASSGNSNFTPTSGTSIVLKWTVSSPCGPDASSTLTVSIFSCQNGGICVHNPCSSFASCLCPTGYSGVFCQNLLSGVCCLPNGAGCQSNTTIVQCNSLGGTWSQNACPPPATVGGPQVICSGGTTAGLGGNFPFQGTSQWSVVSGGTGTFSSVSNPNATFTHTSGAGPIILRWTNTNSVCTTRAEVTVTVNTPPAVSIISNPAPAAVCAGGSTTFTATAGGTGPLHYDWRRGGSSLGAADQNTLTTGVAGSYDVVVSGVCTPTATSNAITLTLFPGGSGDGNASGTVNGDDIQGCVNALVQGGLPSATYCAYDMNADSVVDNDDIAGFVTVLLGP